MINNPPIDELANKVGSKYALCVIASKRARQLAVGATQLTDCKERSKVTIAAYEVAEGTVKEVKE